MGQEQSDCKQAQQFRLLTKLQPNPDWIFEALSYLFLVMSPCSHISSLNLVSAILLPVEMVVCPVQA